MVFYLKSLLLLKLIIFYDLNVQGVRVSIVNEIPLLTSEIEDSSYHIKIKLSLFFMVFL